MTRHRSLIRRGCSALALSVALAATSAVAEEAAPPEGVALREDAAVRLMTDEGALPPAASAAPAKAAPAAGEVDVSYLWSAYKAGDFAAARDEIAVLQRLHPGWQPPADLVRYMEAGEIRTALKELAGKDAGQVIAYYKANPQRFRCSELTIEPLWSVAEAFAKTGDKAGAYHVYGRAMAECEDADLRLSTLQKALALHDAERLPPLFAAERDRQHTDAQRERFAKIEHDWHGDGKASATGLASAELGHRIDLISAGKAEAADVAYVAEEAKKRRDANAAMVLGWHAAKAERWDEAAAWFEDSMAWKPRAKAAEGLALAYAKLDRMADAERVAAAWRGKVEGMEPIIAEAEERRVWSLVESRRYAEALKVLDGTDSAATARQPGILLARGLALNGLDRPFEATALFRQVLDLKPDDETARRAAAGLASALVASGFASEAEAVIARYPTCAEDAPGLERELAKRQAVDAYEAGDYRRAETLIEVAKRRWPGEVALADIEGWTLYHLNRYPEAERVFKELAANDGSADSAKGLQVVERKLYPF